MPYKDKEKRKACCRRYMNRCRQDPEFRAAETAAQQRRRRARDPQLTRMKDKQYAANRRARVYGAPGKLEYEDIIATFKKYPQCGFCGSTKNLVLDHVRSLAHGGQNIRDNLGILCKDCNDIKGGMYIEYRPDHKPIIKQGDKTFTAIFVGG